jgi:hypothetical protein
MDNDCYQYCSDDEEDQEINYIDEEPINMRTITEKIKLNNKEGDSNSIVLRETVLERCV